MKFSRYAISILLAVAMLGCDGTTPQSEGAKKIGSAPKQTIDKVVNEANKAVEQGEARTRDAIDGTK